MSVKLIFYRSIFIPKQVAMVYLKNLFSAPGALPFVVLALVVLTQSGCQKSPSHRGDASAPKATQTQPPRVEPEVNIFVDEPMLAKPYAIIGGAVENVGGRRLEMLSVEIELKGRDDGSVERREVSLEPADLNPGARGKFSLKVLSEDWSGSRVVKLKSGPGAQEVAFRSLPGAKRPPEKVKENVIVVKTPRKKSDGSEFINTPDTPYSVP